MVSLRLMFGFFIGIQLWLLFTGRLKPAAWLFIGTAVFWLAYLVWRSKYRGG